MAVSKLPMQYRVVQIKGTGNFPCPEVVGKYKAVPLLNDTLSMRGLVNHIYRHNGSFGKAVYACVMQEIVDCLVELICEGTPVKLDGLGTFRPTFDCKVAASEEDFSAQENIIGMHIRLYPEQTKEAENLSSKKLLNKVSLKKSDLVKPTDLDGDDEPDEP
jgi:hypothetical protein